MRRLALVALALLAVGCQKNENGTPKIGGTLPGQGMTTSKTYSGTIATLTGCYQSCFQDIPVNADVIDYPSDRVSPYLCRNADCVNGPLPAQTCAQVGLNGTTPCYTGPSNVSIVLGKDVVRFVNAFETSCIDQACTQHIPGYSTYLIQTTITR